MSLLNKIEAHLAEKVGGLAHYNFELYRWGIEHLPTNANELGLELAWQAFEQARHNVPAYQSFLEKQGFRDNPALSLAERYARIPAIDKDNYVKIYTTNNRCQNGTIPFSHVVVDESAGSTGLPYNWVRSQTELDHTRRACSYFHRYSFGDEPLFVINGFSMGAWATGVTVSTAMEANGIVKSTGPDIEKILHTLKFFGTGYRYLITGYPPFLKHLIDYADAENFNWKGYHLMATVGGEAISENLRRYILHRFEKVFSGYGASDLEIGVAGETELSIAIRQLIERNPQVRQALLGEGEHRVPMMFQYNPIDHYIEANANHELIITINRQLLSPRIRYNVKDEGGVLSFEEMAERLRNVGIDITKLLPADSRLPRLSFLYLFGRRDSTLSYMGANIYPEDIEAGLLANAQLASQIKGFAMELVEKSLSGELRPCIHVEMQLGMPLRESLAQRLQESIRAKLLEINADYREAVREDPSAGEILVKLHDVGTGPFATNQSRIKQKYIVKSEAKTRELSIAC